MCLLTAEIAISVDVHVVGVTELYLQVVTQLISACLAYFFDIVNLSR